MQREKEIVVAINNISLFQSLPDICQMIVISGLTTDDDVNVSQICFLTKAKIHYFLLLTKPAMLYLFPF